MAETISMLDSDGMMIQKANTTNKLKEVEDDSAEDKIALEIRKGAINLVAVDAL